MWTKQAGKLEQAFPDTCVGTDSHTTMVNALGVLGWGVGGIEAEAAMLGQPVAMVIPEVIGFGFKGKLKEGVTATDLVLTCTQMLRKRGVVEKFVEYFGEGLDHLSVEDRATIGNMAPEYGATCGFFPVDADTIKYLKATGRSARARRAGRGLLQGAGPVARGRHAAGLHRRAGARSLDGGAVAGRTEAAAGPRAARRRSSPASPRCLPDIVKGADLKRRVKVEGADYDLGHGDVVIAAITSCTNTSNPSVLIAAGLRRAQRRTRRA